ncbi:hypothetical protein D4764_01G0010720 [Takifugu flavidus]|uniref:Uncharacterized protein n=1 Tax=Takifugu flavidus TaxID=433684 RepID=A0A5C6PS89_9TELE|nr:hypothetical protein D4764_01G0010720 [Takifugu flavidus]
MTAAATSSGLSLEREEVTMGILYGEGGDVAADDTEEATTLTWAAGGVERDESKKKTEHRTERRGHVT